MSRLPRPPRPPRPLSAEFMRLKQLQNRAKNLTSYVDGDLVEVAYPTLASGQLVDADKLWKHVKTHCFGPLHCFHNVPVRMFIPVSGEYAGQPIAACGHKQRSEDCKFWVMLTKIHANVENRLLVHEYPARVEALPFSSPVSSQSSQSAQSVTSTTQGVGAGPSGLTSADDQPFLVNETKHEALSMPGNFSRGAFSPSDNQDFNTEYPAMGSASTSTNQSGRHAARPRLSDKMRTKFKQEASSGSSTPLTPLVTRKRYLYAVSPRSLHLRRNHRTPSPPVRIRPTSFKALRDVGPLPQVGIAPLGAPVHYSEPAEGIFKTLMGLDEETGIPLRTLWSMFVVCEVCNRAMLGRRLEDHVCDLTYDSDV